MTERIHYEGGQVLATDEPLTIRGLLLPYGEVGRTNVGRFQVMAGDVAIPSDPMVIGINLDHVATETVGRAIALDEQPDGVYATYRFADTPEGRAAYEDAISPTGTRRKLSAEFGPVVVKAGRAVAGMAKLWGSALVTAGAFPSAQVLAADTPQPDAAAVEPHVSHDPSARALDVTVQPDAEGHLPLLSTSLPSDITVSTPAGESAVYTPEAAPVAGPTTEGASNVTASAAGATAAPAVPPTLAPGLPAGTQVLAGQPAAPAAPAGAPAPAFTAPRPIEPRQVFASIAAVRNDPRDTDALQVLASLTDLTVSGDPALPGSGVIQHNWMGELISGSTYEREYIGLGTTGTDISIGGKKGFRMKRGTAGSPIAGPAGIPNGGNWSGDLSDINSYGGFTQTAESFRRNFAVGNALGREFTDLKGGEEVVAAFFKLLAEDYLFWSDNWALFDLIVSGGVPVAANTSAYPTNYPVALGMLIQGILAVKKKKADGRRDVPTFAILNEDAYEEIMYAAGGDQNLPAFVNVAISTASKGTVDGNVTVVQGDTGITGSKSVIVGSGRAIEFDEIPNGPLVVDALEVARGGMDRAVHGYLQTFQPRNEAFVHIGTPANRATSTAYPVGRLLKVSAVVYLVVTAGTSASSGTPTAPAVGATVDDGTVTLLRLV